MTRPLEDPTFLPMDLSNPHETIAKAKTWPLDRRSLTKEILHNHADAFSESMNNDRNGTEQSDAHTPYHSILAGDSIDDAIVAMIHAGCLAETTSKTTIFKDTNEEVDV